MLCNKKRNSYIWTAYGEQKRKKRRFGLVSYEQEKVYRGLGHNLIQSTNWCTPLWRQQENTAQKKIKENS